MINKCLLLAVLTLVACSKPPKPAPGPTLVQNTPSPTPTIAPQATDAWTSLSQKMPFPYTTPLPPQSPTVLDGLYAKFDPNPVTPVPCRRCPDYSPEGGVWKLSLDQGTYRIFFETTGWHSLGSFVVSGDEVSFFNDPYCYKTVGRYEWQLQGGQLKLELIEDGCQVDRRGRSFSQQPWNLCPTAPTESQPPGCGNGE